MGRIILTELSQRIRYHMNKKDRSMQSHRVLDTTTKGRKQKLFVWQGISSEAPASIRTIHKCE